MAARTELQRRVLRYMRGAPVTLELETSVLIQTLDQLVALGDLELWRVGKPDTFERTVEYRLTQQGRGPSGDEPPELEPAPVSPKPPLSPGGAIMFELLQDEEPVFLSELRELIEKGYLSPDQLKELIHG